jgi:hypothetical protein
MGCLDAAPSHVVGAIGGEAAQESIFRSSTYQQFHRGPVCKRRRAQTIIITVANRTPYSTFADKKPFFVASVSVPGTALKSARFPMDLRTIGVVAQLEWYVLAKVKEQTEQHQEPWLNKK